MLQIKVVCWQVVDRFLILLWDRLGGIWSTVSSSPSILVVLFSQFSIICCFLCFSYRIILLLLLLLLHFVSLKCYPLAEVLSETTSLPPQGRGGRGKVCVHITLPDPTSGITLGMLLYSMVMNLLIAAFDISFCYWPTDEHNHNLDASVGCCFQYQVIVIISKHCSLHSAVGIPQM